MATIVFTEVPFDRLDGCTAADVGQVAIFWPCGPTLAVAPTLEEAIEQWNGIVGANDADTIELDDLAEYWSGATTGDLCYAEIGEPA